MTPPVGLTLALLVSGANPEALVGREALAFPFESYPSWLEFMARAPDPAQRPPIVSEHYPRPVFEACRKREGLTAERLTYRSGPFEVRALFVRPETRERVPLVVFLHGGVGRWGKITTLDQLEFCRWARAGFATLAPTFRGEGGSEGRPSLGDGEVEDVLSLLAVARTLPSVDVKHTALVGFSRGGATVYQVLRRKPDVRLAVIIAGPTDRLTDPRRAEFHEHVYPDTVAGYARDPDAALKKLSAIHWPKRLLASVPLLLLHGDADARVPVSDSKRMARALEKAGRDVRLVVFPKGTHSLRYHWIEVRKEMDTALTRHLARPKH